VDQLQAVHRSRHFDVGEDDPDLWPGLQMYYGIVGINQDRDQPARKLSFVIETSEDYALAVRQLKSLTKSTKDHAAQQELNALVKAIQAWDAALDAAG